MVSEVESEINMSILFTCVQSAVEDDGSTFASMVGTMPSASGSSVFMVFATVILTIVGSSATGYAEIVSKLLS